MIRCLLICVGLWAASPSAQEVTDCAQEQDHPVTIKRIRHALPTPIAAASVPANRNSRPPVPPIPTPPVEAIPVPPSPQTGDTLSPVQHLRRAAEHLEAAAVGSLAEEMCDRAEELRRTADRLEQENKKRLIELKHQLAKIQEEIRKLEEFSRPANQIQVSIKVIEIDAERAREAGLTIPGVVGVQMRPSAMGVARTRSTRPHPSENPLPREIVYRQRTLIGGVGNGSSSTMPTVISGDGGEKLFKELQESGAATILAEPEIVTVSGRPATIHSGGEFPIIVPEGPGSVNIEWRQFGVRAEVVPEILDNGRLRLSVAPEISERDFSNSVNVQGTIVPGITTRRVNTQVEMDFGNTLVVGGLTSHVRKPQIVTHPEEELITGVPVPGKERMFKRVTHDEPVHETMLLVLVTPKLVPTK